MNEQIILNYLEENPEFLVRHAEALNLKLTDKKILSFSGGQIKAAQLKIDKLSMQLHQAYETSKLNQLTISRILKLYNVLLKVGTIRQLNSRLNIILKNEFNIEECQLLLTAEPKVKIKIPKEIMIKDENLKKHIESIKEPYLGSFIDKKLRSKISMKGINFESFMVLPVKIGDKNKAVLLIADQDVNRFQPDLSTTWMNHVTDGIGIILSKLLGFR